MLKPVWAKQSWVCATWKRALPFWRVFCCWEACTLVKCRACDVAFSYSYHLVYWSFCTSEINFNTYFWPPHVYGIRTGRQGQTREFYRQEKRVQSSLGHHVRFHISWPKWSLGTKTEGLSVCPPKHLQVNCEWFSAYSQVVMIMIGVYIVQQLRSHAMP